MNRVLEAIAAERSELSGRLAALEEMERLWSAVEQASVTELSGGEDARVSRPGLPAPAERPKAKREPVRALPPARRSQPEPKRRVMAPSEIAARRARLVALVGEREPVSFGDLQRAADCGLGALKRDLLALRDEGLVDATGLTSQRRYHLTATLDRQTAEKHGTLGQVGGPGVRKCRDDILQTIRSDPGKWTEQRLTDAGAFDREQVADACGHLLEDGLVVLNPDGTYRPAILGLEAAA